MADPPCGSGGRSRGRPATPPPSARAGSCGVSRRAAPSRPWGAGRTLAGGARRRRGSARNDTSARSPRAWCTAGDRRTRTPRVLAGWPAGPRHRGRRSGRIAPCGGRPWPVRRTAGGGDTVVGIRPATVGRSSCRTPLAGNEACTRGSGPAGPGGARRAWRSRVLGRHERHRRAPAQGQRDRDAQGGDAADPSGQSSQGEPSGRLGRAQWARWFLSWLGPGGRTRGCPPVTAPYRPHAPVPDSFGRVEISGAARSRRDAGRVATQTRRRVSRRADGLAHAVVAVVAVAALTLELVLVVRGAATLLPEDSPSLATAW